MTMPTISDAPKRIWAFHHGPMVGYFVGKEAVGAYVSEYILAAEHDRIVAEKDARWSKNLRENYDAFSAMRNDLNETIGDMASQESTLSIGPTMEAECVAVVSAVTRAVSDMRAEIARLTAERDGIAALTVERCAEVAGKAAWKHGGEEAYSQGMDAGARHQNKVDITAILALADQVEKGE